MDSPKRLSLAQSSFHPMKHSILLLSVFSVCSVGHLCAATKSATKSPPQPKTTADLAESIAPSLVKITQLGREGTDGIGSGFIVSTDGLIATNLHVIGEARRLQIEMHDGKTYAVTSIHASDAQRDLALLKIDSKDLKPLTLGDSSKVRQGENVVAMGAPEGLGFSIVQGVLSATREIDGNDMLQVAIPIEKGNSGGPLLDMQGKVLGILTLKHIKTDNLGFAMPVNALKELVESGADEPLANHRRAQSEVVEAAPRLAVDAARGCDSCRSARRWLRRSCALLILSKRAGRHLRDRYHREAR
jgi:S1-C subfamily serine protease